MSKKGVVAVLVGMVAIVGVFGLATKKSPQNAIWLAEKAVAQELKDPDSAKFKYKYLVLGKLEAGIRNVAVCGVVDGKNSFGAFTGGTRFVVTLLEVDKDYSWLATAIEDADKRATVRTRKSKNKETIFEQLQWNAKCVDAAHSPTYTGEGY